MRADNQQASVRKPSQAGLWLANNPPNTNYLSGQQPSLKLTPISAVGSVEEGAVSRKMGLADQDKRAHSRVVRWFIRKRTDCDGSTQASTTEGLRNVSETPAISGAALRVPVAPAVHLVTRPIARALTARSARTVAAPIVVSTNPKRAKAPWIPSLLVFVVAAGLTFAAVYVNALRSGTRVALPRFVRAFLPDTGLGLRIEYQGEHLLVSWDRRSRSVRSAINGVLRIEDGRQRRDVPLDAAQVAAGSVLYTPASDDVTFRLELRNDEGRAMLESIRVLNSAKPFANAPLTEQESNLPASPATRSPKGLPTVSNRAAESRLPRSKRENPQESLDGKTELLRKAQPSAHAPVYVPPVSTPPSATITGTDTPPTSPPDAKTL